jgi:hypothetical protein
VKSPLCPLYISPTCLRLAPGITRLHLFNQLENEERAGRILAARRGVNVILMQGAAYQGITRRVSTQMNMTSPVPAVGCRPFRVWPYNRPRREMKAVVLLIATSIEHSGPVPQC